MSEVKHQKSFLGISASVLYSLISFLGASFLAFCGKDQSFLQHPIASAEHFL